jgi:hypothetical protein
MGMDRKNHPGIQIEIDDLEMFGSFHQKKPFHHARFEFIGFTEFDHAHVFISLMFHCLWLLRFFPQIIGNRPVIIVTLWPTRCLMSTLPAQPGAGPRQIENGRQKAGYP